MNHKKCILYVVSSLEKCGPTNQLYEIIRFLNKDEFYVSILTIFNEGDKSDINKFIKSGIKVETLGLSKTINYFKIAKTLKKYLKGVRKDIVHSCGLAADFSCCFLKNIKHVSSIRNYAYFDYISTYGNFFGRIMIIFNKFAIKNTDYPICCSKAINDMYNQKIKKEINYIQNGVDIDKYKYDESKKKKNREKLNLPLDKKIIIVSGSLCERKDPLFIINNFKELKLKNKVSLVFIGDGELYNTCKKYEDENLIIRGNVNDVKNYLQAADIYISASKSEGLPNSVLEASACGLQIILSKIPPHTEIFEKNMELVEFFTLNNSKEFKQCVIKSVNEDMFNGEKLEKYIRENFSSKVNSEKYSDLYRRIITNYN